MVQTLDTQALRRSSLEHNWIHNRDWIKMAEEGDPLVIVDGKGLEVTDSDGNTYLDVNGGYSCVNVGYGRTEIADAVLEQMLQITFTPRRTTTPAVVQFCEKLAQLTPGDLERSWLVTGGSEANETAIKIAKAYHKRNGEGGRYKVISRKGSYHGATGLTTWLGGGAGRAPFEPAYPRHGLRSPAQPLPERGRRRQPLGDRRALRPSGRGPDPVPRLGDGGRLHRRAHLRRHSHRCLLDPGARVLAYDTRHLRQVRRAAHRRRGDLRVRPHRQMVRHRALGRGARHHVRGQGRDKRLPADGCHHRHYAGGRRLRRARQYLP